MKIFKNQPSFEKASDGTVKQKYNYKGKECRNFPDVEYYPK